MIFSTSLFPLGTLIFGQVWLTSCKPIQPDGAESPFLHRRSPPQDVTIHISIGLPARDEGLLEHTLYEISNPLHRRYGKHLRQAEAVKLLLPDNKAVMTVIRWLTESGIPDTELQVNGQFIDALVPSRVLEALLHGNLTLLKRTGGDALMPNREYLPRHIRRHIQTFELTPDIEQLNRLRDVSVPQTSVNLSHATTNAKSGLDLDHCKVELTPACIREIYGIGDTYADPTLNTKFGVVGFDSQTAQRDQLKKYLDEYAKYAVGADFLDQSVNGGSNPQGSYPSGEGNLDIELAVAMAYNANVSFITVGGALYDFIPDLDLPSTRYGGVEPFLKLARYLVSLPDAKLPSVLVISYGTNEQLLPTSYAKQVCDLFGLLGTRGVSVIAASGDFGAGQSCQSNKGSKATRFLPSFPSTCPYITSVGATQSNSPEQAAEFSGGGFSEYFRRPVWQAVAVDNYLDRHGDAWSGYFNRFGRGIPDVSTLGVNVPIYNHDELELAAGTSASAPIFASMIAVLNNLRAQAKRPTLGFLNPWLYNVRNYAFTDITIGKSGGCPGTSVVGKPAPKVDGAGWYAVDGWDPVTGIGTPIFDKLRRSACR